MAREAAANAAAANAGATLEWALHNVFIFPHEDRWPGTGGGGQRERSHLFAYWDCGADGNAGSAGTAQQQPQPEQQYLSKSMFNYEFA